MKKHQKHNKFIRRHNGNFAPFEVTFLGAHCTYIEEVVISLSKILSSKYKVVHLDASQKEEAIITHLDSYIYNENGDLNILKNSKINSHQTKIDFSDINVSFTYRNHFEGQNQIFILDQNKPNSIEKRLSQIDNIFPFIQKEKIDFFQFLINSEIKKVFLDEKFITNINYKEEYLQTFKNIT